MDLISFLDHLKDVVIEFELRIYNYTEVFDCWGGGGGEHRAAEGERLVSRWGPWCAEVEYEAFSQGYSYLPYQWPGVDEIKVGLEISGWVNIRDFSV